MLSNTKGKLLFDPFDDYVVVDLETTGMEYETDEVIEISAVKVIGGSVVDTYSTLVNPGRHITYEISAITGIMDDMVEDSPDFKTALKGFIDFAGDMVLTGHNIRGFDLRFIYRDCEKFFGKTLGNDYFDTVLLSRIYLPKMPHGLGDMAAHYNIPTEGAHRALNDCMMTQKVYEHLKDEMRNPSPEALAVKRCPKCGNLLKLRDGKFGPFYGCLSFPDCRYTRNP
ncbi:MAG: topoisomerase DNA-binding C4 zinc finger domain-containing protein [Clostridiales bacterium]|nr:topoisomerase DNA-binding C4 zinc finger domain-containing protein [Clostridiales bacterium]